MKDSDGQFLMAEGSNVAFEEFAVAIHAKYSGAINHSLAVRRVIHSHHVHVAVSPTIVFLHCMLTHFGRDPYKRLCGQALAILALPRYLYLLQDQRQKHM
jgi:hypothetical protein